MLSFKLHSRPCQQQFIEFDQLKAHLVAFLELLMSNDLHQQIEFEMLNKNLLLNQHGQHRKLWSSHSVDLQVRPGHNTH